MNKRIILILIFIMVFLTGCTSDNPGYMNVYDTNGEPMEFDSTSGVLVTIPSEHYHIHQGDHYYVSGFDTVADGANVTFATTTPNSSNTSELTVVKGPTVTDYGTMIYMQSAGLEGATPSKGESSGLQAREREIILKQNTTYLWVFISRDDGNIITYVGEWYEHTNRDN